MSVVRWGSYASGYAVGPDLDVDEPKALTRLRGTPQAKRPRAELAAEVARLRVLGLTHKRTGEILGISRSYAAELDSDPTGEKVRRRKRSYGRPCPGWNGESCGKLMDGSNGRGSNAARLCSGCAHAQAHGDRYWTPERVVAAIRRFADEHGRPPVATEWLHGSHGQTVDGYPYTSVVLRECGSWATAVEAAGFPRPARGQYVLADRSELARKRWANPKTRARIVSGMRRRHGFARDYGALVPEHIVVAEAQRDAMAARAGREGTSVAEQYRRAIDGYLL